MRRMSTSQDMFMLMLLSLATLGPWISLVLTDRFRIYPYTDSVQLTQTYSDFDSSRHHHSEMQRTRWKDLQLDPVFSSLPPAVKSCWMRKDIFKMTDPDMTGDVGDDQ